MKNKYYTKENGFKFPMTEKRKEAQAFICNAVYEVVKKCNELYDTATVNYSVNPTYKNMLKMKYFADVETELVNTYAIELYECNDMSIFKKL